MHLRFDLDDIDLAFRIIVRANSINQKDTYMHIPCEQLNVDNGIGRSNNDDYFINTINTNNIGSADINFKASSQLKLGTLKTEEDGNNDYAT